MGLVGYDLRRGVGVTLFVCLLKLTLVEWPNKNSAPEQ